MLATYMSRIRCARVSRPLYAAAIYIRLQPASVVDVAFFDLKRPGAAGSGAIQLHPREHRSELRQSDERWRAAFRHCGDTAVDRRSLYKTLRSPVRLPLLLSASCAGAQMLVLRTVRLGGTCMQRQRESSGLAQGRAYVSPSFSLHMRSHALVLRPLFLCYTHVLCSVCLLATGFPKRLRPFLRRHQISTVSN